MENKKKSGESFMLKLSGFIVDKRNLIFLIVMILLIFSAISSRWVQVENDLTAFLPDDSDTKQGLDVMDAEFTTYGTAQLMIANITYEEALSVCDTLEEVGGVQSVAFDDTEDHYNNASALYTITFDYDEDNDECLTALDAVKEAAAGYDCYVSTDLGNALAESIDSEVRIIMVYVAVIVVLVLIFTTQSYAEIPVLLLTFLAAMILNSGSNFLLGKISFVSNSVTSILQLALSLDYAVILSNRFREEHENLPVREAVVVALSKAIPEISASSLTTIGGLCAMMFMQFKIGPDMGICLVKAIIYALLSTFLLMPGLLMLFGNLIDRTRHKNFVPRIPFVGKFAYKTRFIISPIFLVVLVAALMTSQNCPYVYGYDSLTTPKTNDTQLAENMIEDNFGAENMVALVVPGGDYSKEKRLMEELEGMDQVETVMGLANTEAMDGYTLTDKLTPRQFSELADLDYEAAELLYAAYAAEDEDYGKIVGGLSAYSVPLMDLFSFAFEQVEAGYVTLEADQMEQLETANTAMESGRAQLQGEHYDRLLVYLDLPVGGDETYEFLDTIRETAQSYYPSGDIYMAGDSTNEYDFKKSFQTDNIVVSVVSILIVLVVLLFTFKSAGMPVLLIMVIQGSIWINYSVPALTDSGVFFMSYLVVSSIQMGANIDYAIVISSRFNELKNQMPKQQAIMETMNFAFPTIVTSGTILAVAGTLIGRMTSEAAICGIGDGIGRGTIISIILVMFVLPQLLLVGERLIDRTSFSMPSHVQRTSAHGKVTVDGMVRGEIHGYVSGVIRATVDGDVNVNVISGRVREKAEEEAEDDEEAYSC